MKGFTLHDQYNCKRRSYRITPASSFWWLLAVFLVLTCHTRKAVGQRAIVSLGKRLNKRQASNGNGNNQDTIKDDIIVKDGHVMALGGLDSIDLAFDGIKLEMKTKKRNNNGDKVKNILDGSLRGRAQPGRMLAILGPSGAGKSTLLHAIAGRVKDNPKLRLYGNRYINGQPVTGDSMIPAAFIEQDVQFFPHMTVRETLAFRVELKLGSLLSKHARDEMVNDLLNMVGLNRAADTAVGDNKVRGISGGERKRLSIAVEMISSPALICLDEPTSGLDSTAANNLIQTLRNLANAGKTIIAVIHQPNQHIFSKFDDVLLISEGKQMYYGTTKDVRQYMETYGYHAISEIGTAEHILDCISRIPIDDIETQEQADARIERLAKRAKETKLDLLPITTSNNNQQNSTKKKHNKHNMQRFSPGKIGGPKANILVQLKLLFKRSLREQLRGKTAFVAKLSQQITTALIYGGIYSLGTNQPSVQDRFGLLSLIAITITNSAIGQTIRAFPKEKAIVSVELTSNMYRTIPYFIGKALSELPPVAFLNSVLGLGIYYLTGLSKAKGKLRSFLSLISIHGIASQGIGLLIGAISPSSDVALAIFPAVIITNIIFDGRNISEENTPKILRWIPKIGLIRWGFEGLCLNEFDGLEFDMSGQRRGPPVKTGSDALGRFGLGNRKLKDVFQAQVLIATTSWILSILGISFSRQRYIAMKPAHEE